MAAEGSMAAEGFVAAEPEGSTALISPLVKGLAATLVGEAAFTVGVGVASGDRREPLVVSMRSLSEYSSEGGTWVVARKLPEGIVV